MKRFSSPFISFILLIILAIFSQQSAQSATFIVTNLNNSGADSLRQLVLDANNMAGDDTIIFQSGLSGTITLTSGQITISSNLVINGPGASVLAISGNKASGIFKIDVGATVTLGGLTLKEGEKLGGSHGGGIDNGGTLTVTNSTLSDNAGGYGGGIDNSGTLTVTNSTLSGNGAFYFGGGIDNSGTLTVTNSTLSGNGAFYYGGGINNTGTLTVTNSTLSGNGAEFGGGGIANNTAPLPNDLFSSGTLTVTNSTLSGNRVSRSGDSGAGIRNGGKLILGNTLVAGNTPPAGNEIYLKTDLPSNYPLATFTSLGHNLFGENGVDGLVNVTPVASDLVLPGAIATAIAPLADNGGPTQTHLPVPGSIVVNAGDNALIPAGVTTDQRGVGFPRIQPVNGTVDIGAVEVSLSGDVNGDGAVNALDVVAVINAVLGVQPSPAADVNGDGAVNALDVVFVINRVLGV